MGCGGEAAVLHACKQAAQREFGVALADFQAHVALAAARTASAGDAAPASVVVAVSLADATWAGCSNGEHAQSVQATKQKFLLRRRRPIGPY